MHYQKLCRVSVTVYNKCQTVLFCQLISAYSIIDSIAITRYN